METPRRQTVCCSARLFAGQDVGERQVSDRIWLVSFLDYDLGHFDDQACRLEPTEDPFSPRGLPVSRDWTELDGPQHLSDVAAHRRDRRKDRWLQAHGRLVIRFFAEDVVKDLDAVLDAVLRAVGHRDGVLR